MVSHVDGFYVANLVGFYIANLVVCTGIILVLMRRQRNWDDQISSTKKPMKNDFDYQYRNRLERKLDQYNHIMELVRTIVPVIILGLQIIILLKLVNKS